MDFNYCSWNMKNLSINSVGRVFRDFDQSIDNTTLTAYTNTIELFHIDMLGIIEVTVGTGEKAVGVLAAAIGGVWKSNVSQLNCIGRKGELAALIYNNSIFNFTASGAKVMAANARAPFTSRAPVLFSLQNSAENRKLQVITWHAPQPKHVNADTDLHSLSLCINEEIGKDINVDQPLLISADFNFNTDPAKIGAWDKYLYNPPNPPVTNNAYFKKFQGLVSGAKTTLVAKDPTIRVSHPVSVTQLDFGDILANAYDNIIINTSHLTSTSSSAVVNHFEEFISHDTVNLTYYPATSPNSTQLQIKNANKISDHCAIVAQLKIK